MKQKAEIRLCCQVRNPGASQNGTISIGLGISEGLIPDLTLTVTLYSHSNLNGNIELLINKRTNPQDNTSSEVYVLSSSNPAVALSTFLHSLYLSIPRPYSLDQLLIYINKFDLRKAKNGGKRKQRSKINVTSFIMFTLFLLLSVILTYF